MRHATQRLPSVLFALLAMGLGGACSKRKPANTPVLPMLDASRGASPPGATADTPIEEPTCETTIRGQVLFPNGIEPVPGASIILLARGGDLGPSPACGSCTTLPGDATWVSSGSTGAFAIRTSGGRPMDLIIDKAGFRRRVELPTLACNTEIVLSPEQARLPRTSTEGQLPRIGVMMGAFDRMQYVLGKMGLAELGQGGVNESTAQFTLLREQETRALLTTDGALSQYDLLFANCGSYVESGDDNVLRDPAVRARLRQYVEQGGHLYVTDEAYDFVEQVFPEYIEFEHPGLSMADSQIPEDEDAAEVGAELDFVQSDVLDTDLRDWMQGLGTTDEHGRFSITGLALGWTTIRSTSTTLHTRQWVQGPVSWKRNGTLHSDVRPLAVSFAVGCGRVLYTSYHTAFARPTNNVMTPQEQVLAYLALEVGMCVNGPTIY